MGKKSKRRARAGKQQQQVGQQQQMQSEEGASWSAARPTNRPAPTRRELIQARHRRHREQSIDPREAQINHIMEDPRASANFCMERYADLSSLDGYDPWMDDRVQNFAFYCSFFRDELLKNKLCTEEDWKFLKKIRRSDAEPAFFRFCALELSSWYRILAAGPGPKQDDAIIYFDQASELLDCTSDPEKLRSVDLYGTGDLVKVGDFMAERREVWRAFISDLAEKSTLMAWGPNGDDISVPLIPGSECDCCGRSLRNLGVFTLKVCSVCQLAYYCSVECQKKAWKEQGHKKVCRKKGEFKPGDLAFLLVPVGNISSGEEVRIMSPAPKPDDDSTQENSNQYWVVKSNNDDDKIDTVSAGCLKRIRPGRWNAWGRDEFSGMLALLEAEKDSENGSESESEDFLPGLVTLDQAPDGDES